MTGTIDRIDASTSAIPGSVIDHMARAIRWGLEAAADAE